MVILKGKLDTHRADLGAALEETDPRLRETIPFADGWSVAMVLEHLAQSERGITKLLTTFAQKADRRPAEEEFDDGAFNRHVDMPVFLDRTRKFKLSQPSGTVTATAAWQFLATTRAELLGVLERCAGMRLESVSRSHPTGDELDGYQWVAFLGLHESRHAAQIREISAILTAENAQTGSESSG